MVNYESYQKQVVDILQYLNGQITQFLEQDCLFRQLAQG